jgi:hypothetical protein
MTKLKDFWFRIRIRIQKTPWLTLQVILTVLVVLIFLSLILWSEPISRMMAPATPTLTPGPTVSIPTGVTPEGIPSEYRQNAQQPNINILGAGLMVLIVFVGTLTHLAYKKKSV